MSNTPKLRFKEFSGDWEKKKLGKITKLTDGVHFTPTYVESGVPFWSVETVVSNANPKYITQEAHNDAIKRCNPQINDILLTRIGTLAKPKLINWNEEFSIYVSLALIKASNNYNSKFARYYFETEYYQKDFLSKSLLTATPKKINMEDLKQTNIKLPSLEEQEKIASFFSLIDNKISLQGEKVEALKDYKKGMMQKIFSRELRFKDDDGIDYSEWEEKKLGEFGKFIKTYSFSRSVEGGGNYKHIHYGDIHMNYKGIISKDKWIPSIDIPSDNNYEFIQERDIIFADASEDRKDLGKVAVVRSIEDNVLSGLHTLCFRPKEDLNSEFFLNHSLNKEYLEFMYTRGNGAKVLGISKSNLSEYKFLVPSIEEQEKIANFLENIDLKIEKEQEKLDSLNEYKKGLLQQMFV